VNRTRAKFDDRLLAEPRDRLGKGGVGEPFGIAIVGYYMAIGNALNAFQMPLPAGAPQPFPD
jgi:hypothetical protein